MEQMEYDDIKREKLFHLVILTESEVQGSGHDHRGPMGLGSFKVAR